MNDTLKIIAEFVDKASAGMKTAANNMAEFTKGLAEGAKAEYNAIKAHKAHADSLKSVTTPMQALEGRVKTLAVQYLAITQVIQGFANAIKEADKLDELSGKTGIAASELKNLSYAAGQSDTSLDALVGAFSKLDRAIDKSDEEASQQAKTFAQLGIETEKANGTFKSSSEIFDEVADKFKDMEDGPEKSAAAFRLFGAEGKNLIPILNKGSQEIARLKKEAEELSGVSPEVFNKFAESSGALFDNLEKVQTIFGGLFTALSAELVPVFNIIIEQFISSAKEGGLLRDILNGITAVFKNVLVPAVKIAAVIFDGFASTVKIAGKGIGAFFALIGAVASGDLAGAKAIIKEYGEDVAKIAGEHVEYQNKMILVGHEAVKLTDTVAKKKTQIKSLTKATKETKDELGAFVTKLKEANIAFGQDESVKARLELMAKYNAALKSGANKGVAAAQLAEGEAQIKLNQALRDGAEAKKAFDAAYGDVVQKREAVELLEFENTLIGKSAEERDAAIQKFKDEAEIRKLVNGLTGVSAERITEELTALQKRNAEASKVKADDDRLASLTGSTMVAQNRKVMDDVTFLYQAYTAGKIKSEEEYVQAVEKVLDRLKDKNKEVADETTEFWKAAAQGIEGNFQTFFFDLMQGKLGNLADSFKKTMDQIVAHALAAKVSEAIFGKGFDKTGNMGGYAGAAMSWLGSFFGGFRASGGDVAAGRAYVVGEKRPEIFVPKTSGTILPSTSLASGGGITVQMNVNAVDSQSFLSQLHLIERPLAKMVNNATRKYNLGT